MVDEERDPRKKMKEAYEDLSKRLTEIENRAEEEAKIELKEGVVDIRKRYKEELRAPPEAIQTKVEAARMEAELPLGELKKPLIFGKKDFHKRATVMLLDHGTNFAQKAGGTIQRDSLIESFIQEYKVKRADAEKALKTLEKQNLVKLKKTDSQRVHVIFVPTSLGSDEQLTLKLAEKKRGVLTVPIVVSSLNWDENRSKTTLDNLVQAGIARRDNEEYYFPTFYG